MPRLNRYNLITIAILAGAVMSFAVNANENANADITGGPLDGKTFVGMLGPDGEPKDIPDSFVFANGMFVSKECELRCKYPARPYFVRQDGDKTRFISETRCPYKDAKIIWRGTVDGDTIRGESTWIVRRWYWTYEDTFEFEGKLSPAATDTASSD